MAMTGVQRQLKDDAKALHKLAGETGRMASQWEKAAKRCRCAEWPDQQADLLQTVADLRTQQAEVRQELARTSAQVAAVTAELDRERKAHAFTKRMLAAAVKAPLPEGAEE